MDESIWKAVAGVAIVVLWFAIKRMISKFDAKFDQFDLKFQDQDRRFEAIMEKLDLIISRQEKQDIKLVNHAYILKRLDPSFIVHYPD